jgi:hypothetical protein
MKTNRCITSGIFANQTFAFFNVPQFNYLNPSEFGGGRGCIYI